MDAIERQILTDLANGPAWARSFQHVKPIVLKLIERGDLERVAPRGGRGKNMIALTTAGATKIERVAA